LTTLVDSDTRKSKLFPAALFRILVQDTIYDKVAITVFRNKKFSRDMLGQVTIPVACVSTMSAVPRAASCWFPIRKSKDGQFAQRGELLVSLAFLDGLQTASLPRTLDVPPAGSVVVKVVEAQSISAGGVRSDVYASLYVSSLKHPLEQVARQRRSRSLALSRYRRLFYCLQSLFITVSTHIFFCVLLHHHRFIVDIIKVFVVS
jgi:hypothetical protein